MPGSLKTYGPKYYIMVYFPSVVADGKAVASNGNGVESSS